MEKHSLCQTLGMYKYVTRQKQGEKLDNFLFFGSLSVYLLLD